jgi:DNA polymerase/3'-5' exonuclease PolX
MRVKKYSHMTCQELSAKIVLAEYPNNLKVDLLVAKEIVASRVEFTGGKDHYVIIDVSNVKQVTAEAKEYMQSSEGGLKNILGAAFLASNPVSALIANIFIKSPKEFEAKFFYSKESAIRWIEGLQKKAV